MPYLQEKISSKGSLDPDLHFDALISKVYPGCSEEEASEENALVRRQYNTQPALSPCFEMGQEKHTLPGEEQQTETSGGWESNPAVMNQQTEAIKQVPVTKLPKHLWYLNMIIKMQK